MRNLSEVHGIELIRRIAKERIKKPELKKRVWSDEMQSWGFFTDSPTETDIFLIMGCSSPGDMFWCLKHQSQLFKLPDYQVIDEHTCADPYIILETKSLEIDGMLIYGLELLGSNPPVLCQILADQHVLFKIAWESF